MRRCLTTLVILALVFPIWGVPGFVMAASETNQQSTTEELRSVEECQMSEDARDAIEEARAQLKQDKYRGQMIKLIDQARAAARLPECDNEKAIELAEQVKTLAEQAKTLADKAKQLAKETSLNSSSSETSETSNDDNTIFSLYDGPWEIGYGLDLIYQENFGAEDINHRGLFVGKEISQTDNWKFGIQSHILSSPSKGIGPDSLLFEGYSIFATARHRDMPFLQFKAGLVDAKYENFNGRVSGSGLAYGVALVAGDEKFSIHVLDYEAYNIGDDKFRTYSVSIVIVFAILLGAASSGLSGW